jgi:hypothetical protein
VHQRKLSTAIKQPFSKAAFSPISKTLVRIFPKRTTEKILTIKMAEKDNLSLFFSNEFPFN